MKIIIALIIIYWLAEKLDIMRYQARRRRIAKNKAMMKAQEKARRDLEKRERENRRTERENRREQERTEKEKARRDKEEQKQKDAEKKTEIKRRTAGSELEYCRHRINQLNKLIAYYEDLQTGTIPGGREWIKLEQKIMTVEKQYNQIARKEIALRALFDNDN